MDLLVHYLTQRHGINVPVNYTIWLSLTFDTVFSIQGVMSDRMKFHSFVSRNFKTEAILRQISNEKVRLTYTVLNI